jgi:SPP1 family predicted phage head-tail adaptor
MRLGALRHLVRLEQPIPGEAGALGTPTPEHWEPVADVRASIEPLSGREIVSAKQVDPRTTHKVTIRWRANVSARMRVLVPARAGCAERALQIVSVLNEDERDRTLTLMAQEVAA